jgi:eukaryotic-like serine/threonine-protein kinase
MRTFVRISALAAACAFAVAGCGGGDDEPSTQPTTGPGSAATVPEAGNAQLADAAEQFADQGLRVSVTYSPSEEPAGMVLGQARPAGTELQRGDTVELTVSAGNAAADVAVPDVSDQTQAEAQTALERAGFDVQTIDVPAVAEDTVIYHTPSAATRVPRGSLVIVYAGG